MRWCNVLLLCSLIVPGLCWAESVADALKRGAQLQQSALPADAIRCFREARVEHPDSMALIFALGGAEAALGASLQEAHDLDGALDQFDSARATFERCEADGRLGPGAAYNAATCLLQRDGVLARKGDYKARVENLKHAVDALASVTERFPTLDRAAQNLDYARYQLAMLLQSPPSDPKEEQQNDQEKGEEPVSEVAGATTQLPGATTEVQDGAIVVLHMKPRSEAAP